MSPDHSLTSSNSIGPSQLATSIGIHPANARKHASIAKVRSQSQAYWRENHGSSHSGFGIPRRIFLVVFTGSKASGS